jgi:hypothetical protein
MPDKGEDFGLDSDIVHELSGGRGANSRSFINLPPPEAIDLELRSLQAAKRG